MIKLFSEKVEPTFTSSGHNIITVESFEEVFFDVFEFEINGTKYIAEKESTFKGSPVVAIPVVESGISKSIPFVLVEGDTFEILYNKDAAVDVVGSVVEEEVEEPLPLPCSIVEEEVEDDVIIDTLSDYKKDIFEEVEATKKLAEEFAERIKLQKINEANEEIQKEKDTITDFFSNVKSDLLCEFNDFIVRNRYDLQEYNEQKHGELEKSLTARIEDSFNIFLEQNNDRIDQLTDILNEKVEGLVSSTIVSKVDPALLDIVNKSDEQLNIIEKSLNTSNLEFAKKLRDELGEVERVLVEQNVELNSKIKKGVDKALSRVGNVKASVDSVINDVERSLNESIKTVVDDTAYDLEKKFTEDLELATKNIKSYYDAEIEKISLLGESNKAELIEIIEKSKESLIKNVSKDGKEIQHQLVQEKYDPKKGSKEFDKEVKKLKADLEKSINSRFTQEMITVRRLLELGGGGGSVAMQFADGGTMRGDLTIFGCQFIKSKSFDDYSQECIFRDELVVGDNTSVTFPIRTSPGLSTAKFHATYIGTNGGRSFLEVWVGIADMNCYINGYSVINTDNNNPLLNTISCNLDNGYLNIVSNVNDESAVVFNGKATYVNSTVELLFGQEDQDWFFTTEQNPETFFNPEQ